MHRRGLSFISPEALAPKQENLAPMAPDPIAAVPQSALADEEDDMLPDETYAPYAKRIAAFDDPTERRLAMRESVEAIRKQHRLLAPREDHVILTRLNRLVAQRLVTHPPAPGAAPPAAPTPANASPVAATPPSRLKRMFDALVPPNPQPIPRAAITSPDDEEE